MAALLLHIGFDKMPPTPSPPDEKEITYEDFVKSKRFCNDAEELEGIGVFLGDPCDNNNMNIGAFMYADVANIELNDDGSFYLCIDRTAYSTMGAHAVPLHELEYHLYTWAISEHSGYLKNPQEDRIPDIEMFSPENVKEWCYAMEKAGISYHYDDDPYDHADLFNSWELVKLKYLMDHLNPAQNEKWDIHEFAIDAQKVAGPSPSHTPLQLEVLKKLETLSEAFNNLNNIWIGNMDELETMLGGKAYPFERCFNELSFDVAMWAEKAGE